MRKKIDFISELQLTILEFDGSEPFPISNMCQFLHLISTPFVNLFKQRAGAFGTKVRGCSYFEGDASHTARIRPLSLRIEETEAPLISFSDADENQTEKRRKVFDLNQTILLTIFLHGWRRT